jgi:hypothetical protein
MILVLALVTATLQPSSPKVGDLITVTFPAPVVLDVSRDYEVVSRSGARVVLRTFEPRPFALSGTMGNVRFANLRVPVGSVLKKGDDLRPAPLAPPKEVPYPRAPWIAIAVAAVCAVAAWALVWWRSRIPVHAVEPELTPEERFRRAVLMLQEDASRRLRWAALADATRAFLGATRPNLGGDLTTTELVPRLAEDERVVEDVLRQGDLEKFSPRGAAPRDFEELASRVLHLASASASQEQG